jgi:hypothetical protein
MFQCKVRTEPKTISGKWVEVMNVGERERERQRERQRKVCFFNDAVNC